MWKDRCPRLLERASRLVRPDTKMVFQMGDLIQGDCGDPEVHKKMLGDAFDILKSNFAALPVITVTGNHDIRGTGAGEAYRGYMPQRMSKELGTELPGVNFSFKVGPDAFIFADNEARRHFRALFAKRNVICLCGHVHTTEIADWWGDGGRITQMTMNSVWKNEEIGKYTPKYFGSSQYGNVFAKEIADGHKSEHEIARTGDIFEEYRPGLQRYIKAEEAGCYRLAVGADRIIVEFYAGDSEHLSEGFVLR